MEVSWAKAVLVVQMVRSDPTTLWPWGAHAVAVGEAGQVAHAVAVGEAGQVGHLPLVGVDAF